MVHGRLARSAGAGRVRAVAQGGAVRHGRGAAARLRRGVRRAPVPVLRPGGRVAAADTAPRAARHHHRDRAELGVPLRRDRALAVHDHHRARDVLHRGGLQQHARPAPAGVRVGLRGRRRPGREWAAGVPHRDAAGDVHRGDLRCAARLRALVRRGDRHHLHRWRGEHTAAVDLRRHPARAAASRGQCRGHVRFAAHGDPGGDRGAADRRRRDDPGLGRTTRGAAATGPAGAGAGEAQAGVYVALGANEP